MPPKKKVLKNQVNPEVLKQQFAAWKETAEYKKWEEMSQNLKKFEPVTETTSDLTGPWQEYFNELFKYFRLVKAKTGKIKEIKQEMVRSFTFAKEDKEEEKVIVDGIPCGVVKEHADRAWTLRHKLCQILQAFNDVENLNSDNFQTLKKGQLKNIQEFLKHFNSHVKEGHNYIYETKMAKVLEPLSNLIAVNAQYVSFHLMYKADSEKEIRSFKVKAISEKYCQAFAQVSRILDEQSQEYSLLSRIDLKRVFNKLSYKGWTTNPCERFYLQPLRDAFLAMQKQLNKLNAYGLNYLKIPLSSNEDFLYEMERLIKAEVISERLLGNPLKRDLFNFVYNTMSMIKKTNPFLEENMLKKDENTISGSIPKLIIFKAVQNMLEFTKKQQEFERSEELRALRVLTITQMKGEQILPSTSLTAKKNQESEKEKTTKVEKKANISSVNQKVSTSSKLSFKRASSPLKGRKKSPLMKKLPQNVLKTKEKSATLADFTQKSQKPKTPGNFNLTVDHENQVDQPVEQLNPNILGRYSLLEGYIHPEKMNIFEQAVEILKNINVAVQQDIEDSIILDGLTPKTNIRNDAARVQARLQLEQLQEEDYQNLAVNSIRPPAVWNHPEAVRNHSFRSIAKPKECYVDGRIEELDAKLNSLTSSLLSYKPQIWREIEYKILDIFNGSYNPNITLFHYERLF